VNRVQLEVVMNGTNQMKVMKGKYEIDGSNEGTNTLEVTRRGKGKENTNKGKEIRISYR